MKLVVLTGIPGSGSTTVLKKTLEEVDYLHLNYGDIMTEIAVEKGLVENRDELRKLPADTQKEIQKEAGLRIKERSESENVIVDTHCTISTPAGFLPGLPKWVLEGLNPDTFILVEAHPDEIMVRRMSDETRQRDAEKAKDWLAKGVQPTDTVKNILVNQGILPKPTKLSPAKTKVRKSSK